MDDKLRGRKVLIFQQRGWGLSIGHPLAKELSARGCKLAALTQKHSTHRFITEQKEVPYELVINSDEVMGDPAAYLAGDDFSLAEICRELGIDSIWPILSSERNLARSYKDKYGYGFKQNVSDETLVLYAKAVYKYIKIFFDRFQPGIIITPNFGTTHQIMFNLYAKKRGVPMIAPTDCKIRGLSIFIDHYLTDSGEFFDRIDALNSGRENSPNLDKARDYLQKFRTEFIQPEYADFNNTDKKRTWRQTIRYWFSPFWHSLKWYTDPAQRENFVPTVGISPDYRPPHIIFRDFLAARRNKKAANTFPYFPFDRVGRFAYLPLQVQPESAIDVEGVYASNQIETARQIAMALPDDLTLIVREHPAMTSFRTKSYLEKLAQTPNVKLIDYRLPSKAVLEKAAIIIAPAGTTIAEAALLGKPVIELGQTGTNLKFPNVFKHTDFSTLSKKIKEVMTIDFKQPAYERQILNFIAAAYDTGFTANYIAVWERNDQATLPTLIDIYIKELERRLV